MLRRRTPLRQISAPLFFLVLASLTMLTACVTESGADNQESKTPRLRALELEQLVLVDKNNRRRAILQINKDGQPELALLDKSGNSRVYLGFYGDDQPYLALSDKSGKPAIELEVGQKDRALISIMQKKTDHKLSFQLTETGLSEIEFTVRGQPRMSLAVTSEDLSALFIRDRDGRPRVAINSNGDDKGHGLFLMDKNNKVRSGVMVDAENNPNVILFDANEHPISTLPESKDK